MEEVIIMVKKGYYIPNMAALSGKLGHEIFETIKNSPAPDHTKLREEVEELKAKILAARNNEK